MPELIKNKNEYIVKNIQISQTNKMLLEAGESLPVEIKIKDGRKITDMQRRFIFALCRNLADWQGEDPEIIRAIMMESNRRINEIEKESLTEYSQTEASRLIDMIIDFTISQGITIGNLAQEYSHRIGSRQAYAMALQRVCAVCGRKGADIHHVDQIGTKGNRAKISHIGLRAIPLCRIHHTEAHNQKKGNFIEKHHLEPFVIDKKMEFFIKKGQIKEFKEK